MADQRRHNTLRLDGYDYRTAGGYFVTICTHDRECIFGRIADGQVVLSAVGAIVERAWRELPAHRGGLALDEYVVMPNHLHGIVVFPDASEKPLSRIVGEFKTWSSRHVNILRRSPGAPLWQRNFYDHVIRDDADLARIREYVRNNPIAWDLDPENPERRAGAPGGAPLRKK